MTDSHLNISLQHLKRVSLVTVAGRIDSSTASEFEGALKGVMEGGQHNILLELSGVNYMSSAGLRAMVSTMRECKRNRGEVRLAEPSERVTEVLSLAGLDSLFEVFNDKTAGVGSF